VAEQLHSVGGVGNSCTGKRGDRSLRRRRKHGLNLMAVAL
jgi:hypothetical protein